MNALSQELATACYRQAARWSARMLGPSPIVESILLHRSAATGEVRFGLSDIDLVVVLAGDAAADGDTLASLYQRVRRLRWVNPRLNHVDVHEPGGIQSRARIDTFWASLERRSLLLLRGRPVEVPFAPVLPEHALGKFGLWLEWHVPLSIQRRSRRDLWKTSLESWNACAAAEGALAEPYLLRSEMDARLRDTESDVPARRLEEPSGAAAFVLGLADRLHRARLPALRSLARPLVFEAVMAPLSLQRLFVVLPRADYPLPPEAFARLAFPCTPESLHLYLHYTNAFLYWALPPELLDLGMKPPLAADFLRACRYYGHSRFLFHPGFADRHPRTPAARTGFIRHALEWASRGEIPPAIPQREMRKMLADAPSCLDYYRTVYGPLRLENRRLQEWLAAL